MVSPAGATADVGAFQFTRWVDIGSTRMISLFTDAPCSLHWGGCWSGITERCDAPSRWRAAPITGVGRLAGGSQRRYIGVAYDRHASPGSGAPLGVASSRRLFELPGIANGAA